ncbi:MAG: pyridoxal phosphate-dependent aminotransferase [Candidatus Eremiobacteraeota bacterium]|nr:pyridoxal phosphate-dependent aminotransferase [Candidatus Eremiobacteraeota bacterium]
MLASRIRTSQASSRLGTESAFDVLARARELEALGHEVVHMEIGEPDFNTPEHIKTAGETAIAEDYSHYSPSAGIPELRDAIAEYASRFRGIEPYDRSNIVVGPGAKPIIWNLLSALLDPGDEMLYADPAYPAYESCASYLGAKPVPVTLLESKNFRLDLDELAAKVTPHTKVLVINSPHNPTGGVLTRDDLTVIADLADRHDLIVISDEIYSRNIYDAEFLSIATLPGMRERTIIIDGFSKAYAMTGWRLGYAIMDPALARTVTLFNNNTFSCTATFVQRAGLAALRGADEPVEAMVEEFRKRRDAIVAGLNAISGLSCTKPEGAFYAFANVSAITQNDRALASFFLEEAHVGSLGGSCFGAAGRGYVRFSYATSLGHIDLALRRIASALPRFRSAA